RAFDVTPQRLDERSIARTLVISASEHDKQWSRIDTAVIQAERDLFERCQLPTPCLMKNLAGFGILLGDHLLGLCSGQIGQYTFGKSRIHPEKLERRNDPVAPERCAEPGHSGIRIGAMVSMGHHH